MRTETKKMKRMQMMRMCSCMQMINCADFYMYQDRRMR